jgi:hypothetical protein
MSIGASIAKSFTAIVKPAHRAVQPAERQDPEAEFLASIAHLSPEEQHKRIQTREMYRRMAQRQGIIEVEHREQRSWQ